MRSFALAVALALVACGGEATSPLVASFPMGPKQVRLAVYDRFQSELAPGDEQWPANAPEVREQLTIVRSGVVEVAGAAPFTKGPLKLDPALVSVDVDGVPVDEIELLVGPADAANVDDARVKSLAHAPMPRLSKEKTQLTWTADGPITLAAALDGKLDGQGGNRRIALFVRGRALVHLVPGAVLPVGDTDGHVTIDIPVRYTP